MAINAMWTEPDVALSGQVLVSICGFSSLYFFFHGLVTEDSEVLGDGRVTGQKEPGYQSLPGEELPYLPGMPTGVNKK